MKLNCTDDTHGCTSTTEPSFRHLSSESKFRELLSLYRARHGDEQARELYQRLADVVALVLKTDARPHGRRYSGSDWQEAYRDFHNESLVM